MGAAGSLARVRRCAPLLALVGLVLFCPLGANSAGSRTAATNANPIGDWSSTVDLCTQGWCKGQSFPNPTIVTDFDATTGEFSGTDGKYPITGKVDGNAVRIVFTENGYTSIAVGSISDDGSSWSGTWKDSNHASGTWSGDRAQIAADDLVGRWTLTSSCLRACPGAGEITQILEITSQNARTGTFDGTLDGEIDITGDVGKERTVRFQWDQPDGDGYEASWSGGMLSDDFASMEGGTWRDSKHRSGGWKASRWAGTSGKALPEKGVKPGVGPNPHATCAGSTVGACTGFGGLTQSEIKACLAYYVSCENFAGSSSNLVQGCLGNVLGACLGFGGMTRDDVQVCVASVGGCDGFGGLTPPVTQTCVAYWGSCTGFGGMTPAQVQTCVGNVSGACSGFGPSSEGQLRACIANVVSVCQGFGLGQASATSTRTIHPKSFDPWTLSCGEQGSKSQFLFGGKNGVSCAEQAVITTLSALPAGERELPFAPDGGPKTRNVLPKVHLPDPDDPTQAVVNGRRLAAVTTKPLVRTPERHIGAGRLLVGRLAVTDRAARSYLTRISRSRHPTIKVVYWLRLTVLQNGKPLQQRSLVFWKTVTVRVAPS